MLIVIFKGGDTSHILPPPIQPYTKWIQSVQNPPEMSPVARTARVGISNAQARPQTPSELGERSICMRHTDFHLEPYWFLL